MTAAVNVSDLYRELTMGRAHAAAQALEGAGDQQLMTQAAEALEEAAGALACVTAAYTTAGGELAARWEAQITELVAIAVSLEQVADTGPGHQP